MNPESEYERRMREQRAYESWKHADIRYDYDTDIDKRDVSPVMELDPYISRSCPKCGGEVTRKNGRYGVFYGCSNYPSCRYSFTPPSTENNRRFTRENDRTERSTDKEKHVANTNQTIGGKTNAAVEALKGEGKDAAWQVAANQTVKAVGRTLTTVMKRKKLSKSRVAALSGLLSTDVGQAMFAFGLGAAISASPFGEGAKGKRLARELRVKGMRDAGDLITDFATDPTIELIQSIVGDLPAGE